MFIKQGLTFNRSQALVLKIVAPRVGRAAQQERSFAVVFQIGRDRIKAHEGRQCDRICTIPLKGLHGILRRCGANVPTLGIQNHRHMRRHSSNVSDQSLQLVLCAVRREVRDLRLECTHQVVCRVHNLGAKIKNALAVAAPMLWELAGLRVQAHAQQRLLAVARVLQHVGEVHATDCRQGLFWVAVAKLRRGTKR